VLFCYPFLFAISCKFVYGTLLSLFRGQYGTFEPWTTTSTTGGCLLTRGKISLLASLICLAFFLFGAQKSESCECVWWHVSLWHKLLAGFWSWLGSAAVVSSRHSFHHWETCLHQSSSTPHLLDNTITISPSVPLSLGIDCLCLLGQILAIPCSSMHALSIGQNARRGNGVRPADLAE
jgi:hypothetical protein